MKGRIAQRAYYASLPAALTEAMDRLGRADRPAVRRRSTRTAARTPTRSSSRWGRSPTPPSAVVDVLRAEGAPVGAVARHQLPAVPRRAARRGAAQAPRAVAVVERTDEPAAAANPLTREIKAALYDARGGRGACVPRVVSVSAGLGSRDVERRRPGWPSSTGWRRPAPTTRTSPSLGIRHPLALAAAPDRHLGRRARSRCAATRSAGSARSPRTSCSRRSSASCSASTSRRTRGTARRRRACRRPTT